MRRLKLQMKNPSKTSMVVPPSTPRGKKSQPALWRAIVVLLAWATLGAGARAADVPKSAAAFAHLGSLVGEWKGNLDGTDFQVTYTLVADSSALMEEFRPQHGPTMITMFTVDGDHLLATHYCAAKNQPQMATEAISDPQGKLSFSLVRVTGLTSPGDFHNTDLIVTLEDQDHVTQNWTYLYKGKSGKNVLHFTRLR